ncbi:MAG: 16S rRNA processing protein RimM [Acidobacteriota bacterium]|nr:MAG: 16S rRNA processing protein RimM [Acidobacteriota bacterium]
METFVTVARIVKTRGIHGEVVAEILTDFLERFDALNAVHLEGPCGERWEELERHWFHKGRVVLKFAGFNRPHEVECLIGCEVQVPLSERVEPPEDTYFDSDLTGCEIIQEGESLGVVVDLLKSGGAATNLVVRTSDDREFMIPLARAYIGSIDLETARIQVDLPPGLVELAVDRQERKKRGRDED